MICVTRGKKSVSCRQLAVFVKLSSSSVCWIPYSVLFDLIEYALPIESRIWENFTSALPRLLLELIPLTSLRSLWQCLFRLWLLGSWFSLFVVGFSTFVLILSERTSALLLPNLGLWAFIWNPLFEKPKSWVWNLYCRPGSKAQVRLL